jgi:hypothetical protein
MGKADAVGGVISGVAETINASSWVRAVALAHFTGAEVGSGVGG